MVVLLGLILLPFFAWAWWRYGSEEDAFASLSIIGLGLIFFSMIAAGWMLLFR